MKSSKAPGDTGVARREKGSLPACQMEKVSPGLMNCNDLSPSAAHSTAGVHRSVSQCKHLVVSVASVIIWVSQSEQRL